MLYLIDDRKLSSALFSLSEQPLGLVEETGVFERDAHAVGKGLEQTQIILIEGILFVTLYSTDPDHFFSNHNRHTQITFVFVLFLPNSWNSASTQFFAFFKCTYQQWFTGINDKCSQA